MPRKIEKVAWTIERAASEFTINPRTLSARIKSASIEPGRDGKFSTAQICAAVFGDLAGERLRKTREEADQVALKNAEKRGKLVDFDAVGLAWAAIIGTAKQRFLGIPNKIEARAGKEAGKIAAEEVDDVLRELAKPVVFNAPDNEEEE